VELIMNVCELNKFIDKAEENKTLIDRYRFDPINETAIMTKGTKNITIDLTKTQEEQLAEFKTFTESL